MSLKKKSVRGFAWTLAERLGVQGVSFVVSVMLARMLEPAEFGLIGMITFVVAIGQSLKDSGMTQSLIRTGNATEADYSTVFIINMGMSIFLYALIFISAPLIARFFNNTMLLDIVRIVSLKIPIDALSSIQNTRLTKFMKFRQQMIIQIPSVLLGGLLGIFLAYRGYGVWSLVYMGLAQVSIASLQLWLYSSWRPQILFSTKSFKEHFQFGYKLALGGLLESLYKNLYQLIIGKYFSPAQVGFYNRAWTTKQLPVTNISTALNRVTYPMFAEIKDDDVRLKSVYKRVMQQVLFWIAPILTIAGVLAEPLFRFLFTEKWLPSVLYFQLFCVIGIMYPLQSYNLGILKVKGRSDLFLRVQVLKKIVTIAGVFAVIPFGMMALIIFQVVSAFIAFIFNSYYSGRLINYPVGEQLRHVTPIFGLSLLLGLLCYGQDLWLSQYYPLDFLRLAVGSIFGACTYLALAWLMALEPFVEFKTIALRKLA